MKAATIVDIWRGDKVDLVPPVEITTRWNGFSHVFEMESSEAVRLMGIIDDVHKHAGSKVRILRIKTTRTT